MKKQKVYSIHFPYEKHQFFSQYKYLTKNENHHVFLESGRGGKYSIAGISPMAVAQAQGEHLVIQRENDSLRFEGKPLHQLESWLNQFSIEPNNNLPDFQGGAIGFISYDYVRQIERLPELALDDLGLPIFYFFVFTEWAVFDHEENKLWLLVIEEEEQAERAESVLLLMKEKWTSECENKGERENASDCLATSDSLKVSLSEQQFIEAVEKIQHYISQGDVFQVNLSVRQSKELNVPAIAVYEKLRELNPSPYMAYLHTPDFQIVSGSPELLIKKAGQELSTRPIAGTRSRGKDEAEDVRLASELIDNEKERAEHVMLVDLERNDLGRVCEYGTVEVNEFMVIEKYSHVMHIVSNVRGKLAEEKTRADIVEAVFPGGTITGAPKVRTMEIIEELERVQRGIYTGSIGWMGFNGDMELNIVIRTMLVKDGMCHVQAGAGIVIDSKPKNEYKESLKKAAALWKAKEMAEEEQL
ncbi:MAG TPA: aminodeoxychorismate synthase component I [Chondromyces sp.]|nr:aminodeoxychorismate synthase component I [Chondromyces sp.]